MTEVMRVASGGGRWWWRTWRVLEVTERKRAESALEAKSAI